MIKKTVTIRITLDMSTVFTENALKRLHKLQFYQVIKFHDNKISHLVFLYVSWFNDTYSNWTATEKTCPVICNNKGPDQPAHPRSLISNFAVCFLRRLIPRLASFEKKIYFLSNPFSQTIYYYLYSPTLNKICLMSYVLKGLV